MPNGLLHEVRKLYYETPFFYGPYSWPTLLKLVPVSQILFGTNFPFNCAAAVAKGLTEAGLKAADLHAIERDNALELFPRFRTA
jgi:predicted TIM-barrel fold metal-dependent hydrolase